MLGEVRDGECASKQRRNLLELENEKLIELVVEEREKFQRDSSQKNQSIASQQTGLDKQKKLIHGKFFSAHSFFKI